MNRFTRFTRMQAIVYVFGMVVLTGVLAFATSTLQKSASGKLIQMSGQVTVNGTSPISGATVFSDSTVTTAARSSAVVSLGKLGRVEVLPESKMKLTLDDSSVSVAMLDQGRVRVSSSSNVTSSATTRDGEIKATGNQRNEFLVDTKCGNTFVAVRHGQVELRGGNSVKQIAAGGQDTAGTARPGCTPAADR